MILCNCTLTVWNMGSQMDGNVIDISNSGQAHFYLFRDDEHDSTKAAAGQSLPVSVDDFGFYTNLWMSDLDPRSLRDWKDRPSKCTLCIQAMICFVRMRHDDQLIFCSSWDSRTVAENTLFVHSLGLLSGDLSWVKFLKAFLLLPSFIFASKLKWYGIFGAPRSTIAFSECVQGVLWRNRWCRGFRAFWIPTAGNANKLSAKERHLKTRTRSFIATQKNCLSNIEVSSAPCTGGLNGGLTLVLKRSVHIWGPIWLYLRLQNLLSSRLVWLTTDPSLYPAAQHCSVLLDCLQMSGPCTTCASWCLQHPPWTTKKD